MLRREQEDALDNGHAALYRAVVKEEEMFQKWYLAMSQTELKSEQTPGFWRPMFHGESMDGDIGTTMG